MKNNDILLEVDNLRTYFDTRRGLAKAVDGVSFDLYKGETLGIVGESGCGKSITSLSILNLVPQPKGKIHGGEIKLHREHEVVDIAKLKRTGKKMKDIRRKDTAMIFQDPMSSLSPVYTVGSQIMEGIMLSHDVDKAEAREMAIEMLRKVGISPAEQRINDYPYQLSGGMNQRAMIAVALASNPNLLIADEPTTALDVTVEAQILELMEELQQEYQMSIMFISHDLDVIGEISDRVVVMYTGKVVEVAEVEELFYNPSHPYTQGLLQSIPKIGRKKELKPISGSVPQIYNLPDACHFAPRCPHRMDICTKKEPPTFDLGGGHQAKCWLYEEGGENDEG
ncbi:ABC transporter ATP-binding protein [Halanaerobium sp.]|uniref:ABC transporter ATP-binding protein n=1 Tax=Halanaerobium sp. TaxID=1895664 RepID=UPI000DE727A4|nr:ABC transporter ATP-binding protein [Halanaerobium sp.]PUU93536.1 MAG: oligopeptide/dipeptide ABC transporter, ATP-binding protein [Halanaerobium sp.]